MSADGYSKDPIWPIMARVAGNGSSPPGLKETWRTGEELIREWIGPRSYVAGGVLLADFSRRRELPLHTPFFVSINGVARPLRIHERLSHRWDIKRANVDANGTIQVEITREIKGINSDATFDKLLQGKSMFKASGSK